MHSIGHVSLSSVVLVTVVTMASCDTLASCIGSIICPEKGGCHAKDGSASCDSAFQFTGLSDDVCQHNPLAGYDICYHYWADNGGSDKFFRRCSDPSKDCPKVAAASQCTLEPSGGGEWCISSGSCRPTTEQLKLCNHSFALPLARLVKHTLNSTSPIPPPLPECVEVIVDDTNNSSWWKANSSMFASWDTGRCPVGFNISLSDTRIAPGVEMLVKSI